MPLVIKSATNSGGVFSIVSSTASTKLSIELLIASLICFSLTIISWGKPVTKLRPLI